MTELYGLDKELAKKAKDKYDPERESMAIEYIEQVSGMKLESDNLQESLKNGIVLATMMNNIIEKCTDKEIKPIKVSTSKMPFKQMENIGNYLDRVSQFGIRSYETFQTVDLFENKNMNQVVDSIWALSRNVHQYGLPLLGPKLSQKNERSFTDEQLAQSKAAVPLLQSWTKPKNIGSVAMSTVRQVYSPDIPTGDTAVVSKLLGGLQIEAGRKGPLQAGIGSRREIGGTYVERDDDKDADSFVPLNHQQESLQEKVDESTDVKEPSDVSIKQEDKVIESDSDDVEVVVIDDNDDDDIFDSYMDNNEDSKGKKAVEE